MSGVNICHIVSNFTFSVIMLNYQVKAFEKKERNRSRIELQMLLLKSWVFLVLYLVDYAVNIFSNLSILYMMPLVIVLCATNYIIH